MVFTVHKTDSVSVSGYAWSVALTKRHRPYIFLVLLLINCFIVTA